MKFYIAGKIAGDKDYKAKFQDAEQRLIDAGHVALNPAKHPDGLSRADYMRLCFAMMETADVVLFLPDWRDSPGARLEREWCLYVGKQTAYHLEDYERSRR